MSALDAVEQVLTLAGQPLGYRELARRALADGLWQSEGATPEATVNARLAVDIKTLGAASRFQRTGKGTFALRRWGLPEYHPTSRAANGSAPNAANGTDPPNATLADQTSSPAAAPATPSAHSHPAPQPQPQTQTAREGSNVPDPLSFTDAAEQVLDLYANQMPMHYREMTQRALDLGLIETAGKTPEATLYASILQEIARRIRRGETPRFTKFGRGYLGLTRWQRQGLAAQIDQHNTTIRAQLLARLKATPPDAFETLIGQLLAAMGFDEIEVTNRSGDGGIDVRGTLVVGDVIRIRMAVQVKRWRANVQAPIVQQVRGALGTHEQGLIITTSDFGPGARTEAERPNAVRVGLMNGEQLVALLVEHDIGVRRASHDLIELGEPDIEASE